MAAPRAAQPRDSSITPVSNQSEAPAQPERFVDAKAVGAFLSISRADVLRLTRQSKIRGYAYKGYLRHVYRYRLSEVAEDFAHSLTSRRVQSPQQPLCARGENPMANEVRGWLRQRKRADGMTWLWCYQRLRPSDGKMVENSIPLGMVAEIGDESAAWFEVGELRLVEKYISQPISGKPTFSELCDAYVRDGLPFRKKDGRRKGKGTIETYQYHINNLILPRWDNVIAEDMKPLAIRNWLYDLHDGDDYRWETCSKTAGIMSLVFDFVDHNELYSIRNPMDKVVIPPSEEEHAEVKLLSRDLLVSHLKF